MQVGGARGQGLSLNYNVGMNSCQPVLLKATDAQDKNDWTLRINGQLSDPGLPEKRPRCVCCVNKMKQ